MKIRKKHYYGKRLYFVVLLICTTTLLGSSYAYWYKTSRVEAQVSTGDIDAEVTPIDDSYLRICVNLDCDDIWVTGVDRPHNSEDIKVNFHSTGSVPAAIKSAKVVGFKYYKPTYSVGNGYNGPEQTATRIPVTDNSIRFIATECDRDGNVTLKYDDQDGKNSGALLLREEVEQLIKGDNPDVRVSGRRRYSFKNNPLACIDATREGELQLEIVYTTFNETGWERIAENTSATEIENKTIISIPVYWYRMVWEWKEVRRCGGKSDWIIVWSNQSLPNNQYNGAQVNILPGEEHLYKSSH